MNFKNGYKLVYQKLKDNNKIYAGKSTTPTNGDAEVTFAGITDEELKQVKLVYEKAGELIFSTSTIPSVNDKPVVLLANGEPIIGSDTEADFTPDEYFKFKLLNDGTYTIVGIDRSSTLKAIKIPLEHAGKPITSIGDPDFAPESEEELKTYAFAYSKIDSIIISKAIKNIYFGAFYCSNLNYLEISAFDDILAITDYAFAGCEALTVIISNRICQIGDDAFAGCPVEFISIPAESDSIELNSDSLKTLIINSGTEITAGYDDNHQLAELQLPSSLKIIGGGVFSNSYRLATVAFPDSIISIGNEAFKYSGLTSIVLPKALTVIDSGCFRDSANLTSVSIFNNLTEIRRSAFANCTRLTTINYSGTIEQWNAINKDSSWNSNTGDYTIYCTDGTIPKIIPEAPLKAFYVTPTKSFEDPIEKETLRLDIKSGATLPSASLKVPENENITILGTNFLYNTTQTLSEIAVGDNIKEIWYAAFGFNNNNLQKVTLGNNIQQFNDSVFGSLDIHTAKFFERYNDTWYLNNWLIDYNASSPSAYFKPGIRGIAQNAFYNASTFPDPFILPDSVTAISDHGVRFYKSQGYPTIELRLGNGLKFIGERAFCNVLGKNSADLVIPNSVEFIGEQAFSGDYASTSFKAKSLTIGSGCKEIGRWAFRNTSIAGDERGIFIDNAPVVVGDYAFADITTNNRSVELGYNISRIGNYAFSGLVPTYIPDSVKTIGNNAFYVGNAATGNMPSGVTFYNGLYYIDNWAVSADGTPVGNNTSVLQEGTRGIAAKVLSVSCHATTVDLVVPDSIKYIGTDVFASVSFSNISFTNNSSVTIIENNAFNNCTYLENLVLPNNLEYFGKINNCNNISYDKDIHQGLGGGLSLTTANGKKVFCGVDYQSASTLRFLPDNILIWQDGPNFSGCYNLSSIAIPKEVTYLPDSAFRQCYNLSSISFAEDSNLKYIGNIAFSWTGQNTSISYLKLPESLIKFGTRPFAGANIAKCDIPSKITYLPERLFADSKVQQINFSENILAIGNYAFDNTSRLTDIYYNGTSDAWKNISKNSYWRGNNSQAIIHCTDKNIPITEEN